MTARRLVVPALALAAATSLALGLTTLSVGTPDPREPGQWSDREVTTAHRLCLAHQEAVGKPSTERVDECWTILKEQGTDAYFTRWLGELP